jgi:hypothetical protein
MVLSTGQILRSCMKGIFMIMILMGRGIIGMRMGIDMKGIL